MSGDLRFEAAPSSERGRVLLFHGLTGTTSEVRELAFRLHACGYSVAAPLLLGHGRKLRDLNSIGSDDWLLQADAAYHDVADQAARPLIVCGLSFGALLAMNVAGSHPKEVRAVVLLSPLLKLRDTLVENLLARLSHLPECLDPPLTISKKLRPEAVFAEPRQAYSRHSLRAVLRAFRVRRTALRSFASYTGPVLALCDPKDHLIAEDAVEILRVRFPQQNLRVVSFPGGEHELTIGLQREAVFSEILSFLGERSNA